MAIGGYLRYLYLRYSLAGLRPTSCTAERSSSTGTNAHTTGEMLQHDDGSDEEEQYNAARMDIIESM